MQIVLYPIAIPLIGAALIFLVPKVKQAFAGWVATACAFVNLVVAFELFNKEATYRAPWGIFGIDLSFRLYHFSSFLILAASIFALFILLYSTVSLRGKEYARYFAALVLLTLGLVNGSLLSDNLIALLFFWEGTLITLYGMITIGSKNAWRTATKAFLIVGVCDLAMMVGMMITARVAGTFTISSIHLPLGGWSTAAFLLLTIGAISKAGSMPFHSWIPDAAVDAPLPFMAFLPGAIEKIMGIYLLTRITLDMFVLNPGSWVSYLLMSVGAITILAAVMMALIQKDFKRLLSYHAISQVGYMILGIGTLVPAGIIGGLFHMINNTLYKSCLFLTGGAVEKETGTTDLRHLGGLGIQMPITFACFIITALSISGVPPFNGFFSKEMIYEGALKRGFIFYAAASLGSFFTAASFLKLGHAAFLGKSNEKNRGAKEVALPMLIPMVLLAFTCVVFGVFQKFPVQTLITPILGSHGAEAHEGAGGPGIMLTLVTICVLTAALVNHLFGVRKTGSALKAADHIHHAPVLCSIYDTAEKGRLDPFVIAKAVIQFFARILWSVDRAVDWMYDNGATGIVNWAGSRFSVMHNGNAKRYIMWSLAGAAIIIYLFVKGN